VLHTMHMIEGTIPAYLDGAVVQVPGLSEPETVRFPRLGDQVVRYFGHPEPVTLPRYIEGLRTVKVKGGAPGVNDLIQMLAAVGLASSTPVEVRGRSVVPQELAQALLARLPMPPPEELPPPISEILIIVRGERGGHPVEIQYRLEEPSRMSPYTGIPAVIGIRMLAAGKIRRGGVFPPEGCIESAPFLAELVKAGFVISESETVKRILTI
jgi:saccharopine dehydrogenase-like NADP-dependent oxidoreductase